MQMYFHISDSKHLVAPFILNIYLEYIRNILGYPLNNSFHYLANVIKQPLLNIMSSMRFLGKSTKCKIIHLR